MKVIVKLFYQGLYVKKLNGYKIVKLVINMKFKIKSNYKRAKTGVIKIGKKKVETPVLAYVATNASVKGLTSKMLKELKVKLLIVNTYHLMINEEYKIIEKVGIHKFMNFKDVIESDSGGFQVFSLGFGLQHGVGKIIDFFPQENKIKRKNSKLIGKNFVKIEKDGVTFKHEGKIIKLTPSMSIQIQSKIGSDIVLTFDECTSPLHDYNYTKAALERTKLWTIQSLEAFEKYKRKNQNIFAIVQGGFWKDLRKESAKFIKKAEKEFRIDGYAIGGSLGKSKEDMLKVIDYTQPILQEYNEKKEIYENEVKPIHLLGIGTVKDLFISIERGIDMFDCVTPTRLARVGYAYLWNNKENNKESDDKYRIRITKEKYKYDYRPIDETCNCYVCRNYSRAYLRHLWKKKELEFYTLMTYHNIYFFQRLLREIRESIEKGYFNELKEKWLIK